MKCPSCGKEFESVDAMRHTHDSYLATFTCPYCKTDLMDVAKKIR